jgi:hypothetical protein
MERRTNLSTKIARKKSCYDWDSSDSSNEDEEDNDDEIRGIDHDKDDWKDEEEWSIKVDKDAVRRHYKGKFDVRDIMLNIILRNVRKYLETALKK